MDLITAAITREPWASGCLEGRRHCASGAERRRESVPHWDLMISPARFCRCIMERPRKRPTGWFQRRRTSSFFEQRISHAVVHVSDEETAIDVPSGAGIRLGPRIVSKATCNAFKSELERLRELLRCNALRVERCPITRKSVSLSCRICQRFFVPHAGCWSARVTRLEPGNSLRKCSMRRKMRSENGDCRD